MFHSARIKLTAWYLLIIMLISLSFSAVIYRSLSQEFDRLLRSQRLRQQGLIIPRQDGYLIFTEPDLPQTRTSTDIEIMNEAKERLFSILGLINLGILAVAGGAGYFLAGRTLQPIQEMVDEQNRFIADASHELRTPITSLKTEIEVTLRDKSLDAKEAKNVLLSSLEEVNNLQRLSDSLIKLNQYQKGTSGLVFETLLLNEVIQKSVKRVEKLAKYKDINLLVPGKSKIKITGDEQSLIDLFTIFLDNAIKYSPNKTSVTITQSQLDHFAEVTIKDEGIGISQEEIPHLFDRFYRADSSRTKNKAKGYGLGLSIAKQIVEKHHGDIKVESKIGEGASFIIKLPKKK